MIPWIAHFYTALGAVAALLAAAALFTNDFRSAFIWLGVQIFIDSTDGLLARAVRVQERIPWFDGSLLDNIIDYITYVFVPALIVIRAELVPSQWSVWIGGAMLIASAYGFSRSDAKVKVGEYFFTGFPSYWNIVVLYLLLVDVPPAVNAIVLLGLSALVFVRIGYVYPSRTGTLQRTTLALGAVWTLLIGAIIWMWPSPPRVIAIASLLFPVYYLVLSLVLHSRRRPVAAR